jgi:hypothetical protein
VPSSMGCCAGHLQCFLRICGLEIDHVAVTQRAAGFYVYCTIEALYPRNKKKVRVKSMCSVTHEDM